MDEYDFYGELEAERGDSPDDGQTLNRSNEVLELMHRLFSVKPYFHALNSVKRLTDEIGSKLDAEFYSEAILRYRELRKLTRRLEQAEFERVLGNKAVVGVGGRFSAGKSCFINSLLRYDGSDADVLPEDSRPTTSIATYLVRSDTDEFSVHAYTNNGGRVYLSQKELELLTHGLSDEYKFSASHVIHSLVAELPGKGFEHISLLDTPGYSKPDSGNAKISDKAKAARELKSANYLIWLIDVENGELTADDINFIRSLEIDNGILFVVNKADKKAEYAEVTAHIEHTARANGLPVYAVAAYSSLPQFGGKFAEGQTAVRAFLKECDKEGRNFASVKELIVAKAREITTCIVKRQTDSVERTNKLKALLRETDDPHGKALLNAMLKELQATYKILTEDKSEVDGLITKIAEVAQ